MRRPLFFILMATGLWGASSALMAREEVGLAGGGLVALAGGTMLLLFALAGGQPDDMLRVARLAVPLGILEAFNLGFFALALKQGSVPIAVATHLSAPLILMGAAIAAKTRTIGPREITIAFLVGAGIVAIGLDQTGREGHAVAGAALGLASAVSLAILISRVASVAPAEVPQLAAAWQLLIAGALLLPLALFDLPSVELMAQSLGIGAIFLGPGFFLYWKAMQKLDASTAAVLGLNEAVVAGILAWLIGSGAPSTFNLVGALAILFAIVLEITSPMTDD